MTTRIKPEPISGFPEFLPAEQLLFNRMLDIIRRNFERSGFSPIETPAVERKEVLTAKGGDDREIYSLSRLRPGDEAGDEETDLALHFDLTVPLARYVAMNQHEIAFPFRRYQMQKVWRGERAQAERYREFYQCDIDVIGRGSLGILHDAELPGIIYQIFREINIGHFVIRVSNRRVLQGYFRHLGIADPRIPEVMHAIDKLEKVGADKVIAELNESVGMALDTAQNALNFLGETRTTDETLAALRAMDINDEAFTTGLDELQQVVTGIRSFGVPDDYFTIDMSVVRGLEYYTGTIYETQLTAHPEIGSICSGGRYDDLAGFFTGDKLPGIGISIGLTRLFTKLLKAGVLTPGTATVAPVLVTTFNSARMNDYMAIASQLRAAGIATEIYLEEAGIGKQLKYANRKGFQVVIIIGDDEFAGGIAKIKNMVSGDESEAALATLTDTIKAALTEV